MRSLPLNCSLDSFSFNHVNIVRLKVFDAGRVGNANGISRKIEPRLDHIASRSTDLRSDRYIFLTYKGTFNSNS